MFPKGLIIAVSIGLISGPAFGYFLYSQTNSEQLVYTDYPSISLVTEKTDFILGEDIIITVINSGTTPVRFNDSTFDLRVTGLEGFVYFTPEFDSTQSTLTLEPGKEKSYVWNQMKPDGTPALEGRYKISTSGYAPDNSQLKKSIVINLLKYSSINDLFR